MTSSDENHGNLHNQVSHKNILANYIVVHDVGWLLACLDLMLLRSQQPIRRSRSQGPVS